MTVLDANLKSRGKWGWWGDPNVTDEMIVDYEMRNKRYGSVPIGIRYQGNLLFLGFTHANYFWRDGSTY
jgi:hypothetical protein